MTDQCTDLFKILEAYENNFGPCYNKLRLILDFASICFKQSFVFEKDSSFQERLKNEVLVKAGERAAIRIMEAEGFEAPFSISRKSQMPLGKNHIIEVINKFTKELIR